MRFKPNQRTTHLGTPRKFSIIPVVDAPEGFQRAFFTTVNVGQRPTVFAVRPDAPSGQWRIDRGVFGNLWEAFPGLNEIFETPELAAQALVARFPQ